MEEILSAKANCCPEFCNALTQSEAVIAEAVPGDLYWSTGLTKEQCLIVKQEESARERALCQLTECF